MVSKYLDIVQTSQYQFEKKIKSDIIKKTAFGKTDLYKATTSQTKKTEVRENFPCFLNREFISRLRFEDVENINKYDTSYKRYQNRYFRGKFDQWKIH